MPVPAETEPAGATRIRRAEAQEAAFVGSMVRETFLELYRDLDHPVPRPTTVDFAPLIAEGQVWMIEAATEAGHEPVGMLVLEEHPGYLRIDIVAIRPAHQHRGHGRAALAFTEAHARANGFAEVRFYTNTLIARNIAFYRACGYIETARWPHAKRRGEIYVDFVKAVGSVPDGGHPETALDRRPPRAT